MDNFEKRLKQDAHAVNADISPELRARIDASLRGVEPVSPANRVAESSHRLWWVSSLTGLATAIAIIVMLNMNQNSPNSVPVEDSVVDQRTTVPVLPDEPPLISPMLDIQTADFASPLEEELLRLQSDLEKARNSVQEDVDFTF